MNPHDREAGAPARLADAFRIGGCRVVVSAGTIERDGVTERLEPKVMSVLVALAERAGRVVTKDELLGLVWPDTHVEEGALARSVSALRRVLGDSARHSRLIETLPRRGYRLMARVEDDRFPATWRGDAHPAARVRNRRAVTLTIAATFVAGLAAFGTWLRPREPTLDAQGLAAYREGRVREAIDLYRESLALAPRSDAARVGLADAYAQRYHATGDPAWSRAAVSTAEAATATAALSPEALKALGHAYASAGRFQAAAEAYERALALRPEYAHAANNLGAVHLAQGRLQSAAAWFRRALEIDPASVAARVNLGEALRLEGRDDEARLWLTRAVQVAPRTYAAHEQLAMLDLVRGSRETAAARMQAYLDRNGPCQGCLVMLGLIARLKGDAARAVTLFERARAFEGDRTLLELRLAEALIQAGDEAAGRRQLAAALAAPAEALAAGSEWWGPAWSRAAAAAAIGDAGAATAWLERAIVAGRRDDRWDRMDPLFERVRGHPAFRAALDEMSRRSRIGPG